MATINVIVVPEENDSTTPLNNAFKQIVDIMTTITTYQIE